MINIRANRILILSKWMKFDLYAKFHCVKYFRDIIFLQKKIPFKFYLRNKHIHRHRILQFFGKFDYAFDKHFVINKVKKVTYIKIFQLRNSKKQKFTILNSNQRCSIKKYSFLLNFFFVFLIFFLSLLNNFNVHTSRLFYIYIYY